MSFLGYGEQKQLILASGKKKGGRRYFKSLDSLPAEMGKPGERKKHELPILTIVYTRTQLYVGL